jgi:hypothetical protein
MVWAYMGPKELEPPFPEFAFNVVPEENVWANHSLQPSNWLQGLEGDVDAAHGGYLHFSRDLWEEQINASEKDFKFLFDPRPATEVQEMPWGLQTMFRFALENPSEATFWVHPFVMPFFALFGRDVADVTNRGGLMHAWIPSTDTSHYVYSLAWNSDGPYTDKQIEELDKFQKFTAVDKENGYIHAEWNGSGYTQDRESMRDSSSFSGFHGVHLQDLAVQQSMGPIVDRTREHLGAEDFLVIQVRKFMLAAMERHEAGEAPPGLQGGVDYREIAAHNIVGPSDTPLAEMLNRTEFVQQRAMAAESYVKVENAWSPLPVK